MHTTFAAVANRLTTMRLDFDFENSECSDDMARLLAACVSLRHLELSNLTTRGHDMHPSSPAPAYHLASFRMSGIYLKIDRDNLGWLIGDSAATLKSVHLRQHYGTGSLASSALGALKQLAPNLEAATFGVNASSACTTTCCPIRSSTWPSRLV